ncbi:sulfurtransferase [Chitinophaga silvatica]|uniref:Sulfurtransferase n=1 Tax=Chitinophaga silvatica TaxID=2282649 RepID=A0A3E1Y6F8_9BACT|nr:sulfurtransferase [Chitinophaga silvatica]RFS20478.1 sulfurtransferase [Chitinophaga silvatica]
MEPIITLQSFKTISNQENLIVFDVRVGKDAYQNYLSKHLKNARFVNLDKDLAAVPENAANGGRHPLPAIEDFRKLLEESGVSENSHIVVYDDKNGANAAARLWWMLKAFGLKNVQVLDGGFQAAEKADLEFSQGEESFEKGNLSKRDAWSLPLSSIEEVEKEIANQTAVVIDVRDAYRYRGESEPIDLVAGHIPGAINIPFSENLDENGNFLVPQVLKDKYSGLLSGKPEKLIVHCGSGVTACHTILALTSAGFEVPNLYVGSWSEWSRRDKPVAKEI